MGLTQAYGSGGSAQSAQNRSQSQGYSINYPTTANANAADQAALAYARQIQLQQMAMDFNREEAQKQRDWQTEMANTIYTRSIKNMREAGINPVLAASMGLSGAGVSSGATASISGASAPMAQTFMGAESANSASSWGQSQGSSWNQSESGIMTFLSAMDTWVNGMIGAMQSGKTIEIALTGLDQFLHPEDTTGDGKKDFSDVEDKFLTGIENILGIPGQIKNFFNTKGSEKYKSMTQQFSGDNNPYLYKTNGGRMNESSWD